MSCGVPSGRSDRCWSIRGENRSAFNDAEREWVYDRRSSVGRLDKALDEAPRRGWTVVDMKQDWKVVYPFQK